MFILFIITANSAALNSDLGGKPSQTKVGAPDRDRLDGLRRHEHPCCMSGKASNGDVVVRPPIGAMVFVVVVTMLELSLALALLVTAGVLALSGGASYALLLALFAIVFGALSVPLLRDLRGRWGWRLAVGRDRVRLDLPPARSAARRTAACHRSLAASDLAAIELRLEAYRSWRLVMLLRAVALRLRTGERIFLGEDRAVGTRLGSNFVARAAATLAEHTGCPLRDMGLVEGRSHLLGLLMRAPAWRAAPVDEARRAALLKGARATGEIVTRGALAGILSR